MRAFVCAALAVLLVSGLAGTAVAEPATQTYAAPADRVWKTTEAVLRQFGWDIDKSDRSIGWIETDSRRVEGEDYGVYAKGTRHRLRVNVQARGDNRTTVTVERTVFKRERILWMDKDEPVSTTDQSVERGLLAAIEKSL
jgi:hypothetical protein